MKTSNTYSKEALSVRRRVDEYDFVKGLLIIFVIWGHVCMYSSSDNYNGNVFTYIIRLFQMPMFILISGLFFKSIYNIRSALEKSVKLFKHIAVPLIFWVFLTTVTRLIMEYNYDELSIIVLLNTIRESLSVYWYFICLLFCMYFTLFLMVMFKNRKCLWGGVVILLLIPINIYNFQFLYLFFIIGVSISEYKMIIINKWKSIKWMLKAGLLFIIVIGSQFYPTSLTFYSVPNFIFGVVSVEFLNKVYSIPSVIIVLLRYVIYLISTISWLLFFCELFQILRGKITNMIKSLGKETLFLFVSHLYILVCFTDIVKHLINLEDREFLINTYLRFYLLDIIITALLVKVLYKSGLYLSKFKALSLWMQGKI